MVVCFIVNDFSLRKSLGDCVNSNLQHFLVCASRKLFYLFLCITCINGYISGTYNDLLFDLNVIFIY